MEPGNSRANPDCFFIPGLIFPHLRLPFVIRIIFSIEKLISLSFFAFPFPKFYFPNLFFPLIFPHSLNFLPVPNLPINGRRNAKQVKV